MYIHTQTHMANGSMSHHWLIPKQLWCSLQVSPTMNNSNIIICSWRAEQFKCHCIVCTFVYTSAFLTYLLLLNIHHSIMNGDKNVLRVHVVHQTTRCEDLQDAHLEDRNH